MKGPMVLAILLACGFSAQAINVDSLVRLAYDESLEGERRHGAMVELVWHYSYSSPDSALVVSDDLLSLSSGMPPRYSAQAYKLKGVAYFQADQWKEALSSLEQALSQYRKLNDRDGMAHTLNIVGAVNKNFGRIREAVQAYGSCVRIALESEDSLTLAMAYTNLGNLYSEVDSLVNAMKYYTLALEVDRRRKNKEGELETLHSLAVLYKKIGDYSRAIGYFEQARELYVQRDDPFSVSLVDLNIANLHWAKGDSLKSYQGHLKNLQQVRSIGSLSMEAEVLTSIGDIHRLNLELDSALWYLQRGMEAYSENENLEGMVDAGLGLGETYLALGAWRSAIVECDQAYRYAKAQGFSDQLEGLCRCLHQGYRETGQETLALEFLEEADEQRLRMAHQKSSLEVQRTQLGYHFNKQKAIDSLKNLAQVEREQTRADMEAEKAEWNETLAWSWAGGVVALLGLLGFVGYRYVEKKKTNQIILAQKAEVETQREQVQKRNDEIMQSITYAKRLQEAIMPSPRLVKEVYRESMIYYEPKDIVAGDFYWTMTEGDNLWIAAADCTGHGVPGAMVSVVCANALNRAFNEKGLREPGDILDHVREIVIDTYSKGDNHLQDGMDIALCRLDMKTREVAFSGANNPLWVLRTVDDPWEEEEELEVMTRAKVEKISGVTLLEVKGDKQPVGLYSRNTPFTTHRLSLLKGDTFYLFSDGFADQFGGEKGKKFKYGPFKQLLCGIQDEGMDVQQQILDRIFQDWRGDAEQVDDVCVIGVRV